MSKRPDKVAAYRFARRPFKGAFFYEWQIGSLVFQVRHTRHSYMLGLPRVTVWRDPFWRSV